MKMHADKPGSTIFLIVQKKERLIRFYIVHHINERVTTYSRARDF